MFMKKKLGLPLYATLPEKREMIISEKEVFGGARE
jgi:hypothetical protein